MLIKTIYSFFNSPVIMSHHDSALDEIEKWRTEVSSFFYSTIPSSRDIDIFLNSTLSLLSISNAIFIVAFSIVLFSFSRSSVMDNLQNNIKIAVVQAFKYSSSDKLGHLVMNSLELMQSVFVNGPNGEVSSEESFTMPLVLG